MADEHQTNAIIATAVLDSFRGHSDHKLDPEEAKIIANASLPRSNMLGFRSR
jgi:hypothetical protein